VEQRKKIPRRLLGVAGAPRDQGPGPHVGLPSGIPIWIFSPSFSIVFVIDLRLLRRGVDEARRRQRLTLTFELAPLADVFVSPPRRLAEE